MVADVLESILALLPYTQSPTKDYERVSLTSHTEQPGTVNIEDPVKLDNSTDHHLQLVSQRSHQDRF